LDNATGVKLAIPTALLVGAPTIERWGRNWKAQGKLSIDTINWGNGKTLQEWYDELLRRYPNAEKEKGRDRIVFKSKETGSFYFHVEGRSNSGEVRGLSVVWTQRNLAPVVEAIVASFDAFPKKIIPQATLPDRREIDDREKQITQLTDKITERDARIKNLIRQN